MPAPGLAARRIPILRRLLAGLFGGITLRRPFAASSYGRCQLESAPSRVDHPPRHCIPADAPGELQAYILKLFF